MLLWGPMAEGAGAMKGQPVLGCDPTATPDFTLKKHVPGILDKRFQEYLKEPVIQVRHVKNGD